MTYDTWMRAPELFMILVFSMRISNKNAKIKTVFVLILSNCTGKNSNTSNL